MTDPQIIRLRALELALSLPNTFPAYGVSDAIKVADALFNFIDEGCVPKYVEQST